MQSFKMERGRVKLAEAVEARKGAVKVIRRLAPPRGVVRGSRGRSTLSVYRDLEHTDDGHVKLLEVI